MGLFGRSTTQQPDTATSREYLARAGDTPRKTLLLLTCLNRIDRLPVAGGESFGIPATDTYGLGPASQCVSDALRQDASMCAWVAREAFVVLDTVLMASDGTWVDNLNYAMRAMGLDPGPSVRPPKPDPETEERILGLAAYAMQVLFVVTAAMGPEAKRDRAVYEHLFTSTATQTQAVGHDLAAWACVAVCRLRSTGSTPALPWFDQRYVRVPELYGAGWYPNPYGHGRIENGDAIFHRYWSGQDWTERIRVRQGRDFQESIRAMNVPPNN